MFKIFKKITSLVIIISMLLMVSVVPCYAFPAQYSFNVTKTTVNYVALGDSIAVGMSSYTGSTDSSGNPVYYGYTDMYRDYLKIKYKVNYSNLSYPGANSQNFNDMLKLVNLNPYNNPEYTYYKQLLSNADIVTLSLGGNNLLGPFINAAFGMYSLTYPDFNGMYNAIKSDPAPLKTYSKLDTAISGYLDAGANLFISQWNEIISVLKALAPSAKIYVTTVYNPLPTGDPLYKTVNGQIIKMNNAIKQNSGLGYKVADIYSPLRTFGAVNYNIATAILIAKFSKGTSGINAFISSIDPHPTMIGHGVIFKTLVNVK